jgi:periplasmic protein TonB
MAYRRKEQPVSKLSAVISLVFHALIIGGLVFFAARQGLLGKQLKKIAVTMVPQEKPPEKPKEKPPEKPPEKTPENKPKDEPAKVETAKAAPTSPPEQRAAITAPPLVAPSVAPPAAEVAGFDFEGGQLVETSSNPQTLYKGFVEYKLRSTWKRPEGVADQDYVAEVELGIDPAGRITGSEWKKGSGDAAWDNSVRQVVAQTKSIGRPPPQGFPEKIVVRFDVLTEADALAP